VLLEVPVAGSAVQVQMVDGLRACRLRTPLFAAMRSVRVHCAMFFAALRSRLAPLFGAARRLVVVAW